VHHITALRVLGVLAFYAAMFVVIRLSRERIEPWEKRTFAAIAVVWALPVHDALARREVRGAEAVRHLGHG
jgi:hypothetical protein